MTAQVRPLEPGDGSRALRPVILVVDDEPGLRESFRLILDDDYEVVDVPDGPAALDVLRSAQVDLVLLDIRLPGMDGIEVLERIKALDESVEVILVTAVKTVRTAVAAMKLGAFDYLTKPLIVGQHPEVQKLFRLVSHVSRTSTTVLITGESGTGKELIARAIHRQSPRRDKPFVAVNPAAIADTLIESELFGHEKGAFTGAFQRKLGRFELAQGGTLFLDEIATLRPELQAKLLRVLQEREIERVGSGRAIKIDVRIIAATNVDLTEAVARGGFRDDLYYRLNVVHLAVPPLRARREDIPLLVRHFIRRFNHEFGKRIDGPTPEALAALCAYGWPGNVRELQNVVERSAVLVEGASIGVDDLPMELSVGAPGDTFSEAVPLNEATDRFERQMVLRMLDRVDGNVSEAARALGIHRNSLKAKLARWKIRARDLRSGAQ
ncbi:MAG: sigma-54-dependent Fis family transcriptional regulator [Candidatus Rokuibacteriota bacterium]|nr:MAG: sigma-54-dependent Fis family transcriptional regulator [Candidatus Rokubacteria bacterium]